MANSASTWDRHAERYTRQERLELRAIDRALELADPRHRDELVDVATGTGLVLRRLALSPCRPERVVGIDRSQGMLDRGGPLPAHWRLLRADARDVPLPDGVADVVVCCYLLHLLGAEDRRRVLGEARRLLASKAGSRLVTVTVWADRRKIGGRVLHAGLSGLAGVSSARFGGLEPLDPMPELRAAGLVATHRSVVFRGGYPSLVLRARPA